MFHKEVWVNMEIGPGNFVLKPDELVTNGYPPQPVMYLRANAVAWRDDK